MNDMSVTNETNAVERALGAAFKVFVNELKPVLAELVQQAVGESLFNKEFKDEVYKQVDGYVQGNNSPLREFVQDVIRDEDVVTRSDVEDIVNDVDFSSTIEDEITERLEEFFRHSAFTITPR